MATTKLTHKVNGVPEDYCVPVTGSGGGGTPEEILLEGDEIFTPGDGVDSMTLIIKQDAIGGRTFDLSSVRFTPGHVDFISEEPDAISMIQVSKGEDGTWYSDSGVEWRY